MATWGQRVQTSSGGNVKLGLEGGYGTVTRNGATVSFPYGFRMGMGSNISGTTTWSTNGFCAWLPSGGTKRWAKAGGTQSSANVWYYANGTSSSTTTGESTPVTYSGSHDANTSSVSISIGTAWNATTPTAAAYTYTFSVPIPTVGAPTVSASVDSIGRDTGRLVLNITNDPYNYWRVHWYHPTTGAWVNCSGFSTGTSYYTMTGLTANTAYTARWRWGGPNDWNVSGEQQVAFTTSGNIPTITSTSADSITRTGAIINSYVTYDTNASFSSREIQYGLTTSYGTSTTSNVLSGLNPNTVYYYRARIIDNWSRSSDWSTGSFTTSGNAPTIASTSVTGITAREATIEYADSYDTNASHWLTEVEYGLSISYGQSKGDGYLIDLTPGSLYYYRVRVQDDWNRYSAWSTGTFTTLADSFVRLKLSDGTLTDTTKIYLIDEYGTKTEITKQMFNIIT